MARFSEDDFDFENYIKARPDIEQDSVVWTRILRAHDKNGGQYHVALDLGCGPAKQVPKLAALFDETLHVDVSAQMLQVAAKHWQGVRTKKGADPHFKEGSATNLSFIETHSIDLVVAGNAVFYFRPLSKFWAEMQRIVRPGGTVAFWGSLGAFNPKYEFNKISESVLEDSRVKPYENFPWKEVSAAVFHLPTPGSEGMPTKLWESSRDIASAEGVDARAWTTERWEWQHDFNYNEGDEFAIKVRLGKDDLHNMLCSLSMYDKYLHVGNIEKKSDRDFAWQLICETYPKGDNGKESDTMEYYIPCWLTIVNRNMDVEGEL